MPLSFGGGIRSVKDVEDRIYNGADKIIINSLLFTNKEIVSNIIDRFGSQYEDEFDVIINFRIFMLRNFISCNCFS